MVSAASPQILPLAIASDLVVALGGKILLAEFPELCGAEQNLIDRTMDEATARKFIHLMQSL